MDIFKADEVLANLLIKYGFKDMADDINRNKNKTVFKLRRQSTNSITFDYINIRVVFGHTTFLNNPSITEAELRTVLLLFLITPKERQELMSEPCELSDVQNRIKLIKAELKFERKEVGKLQQRRLEKLQRIIDRLESITFEPQQAT